jgi:type I restriction enzyme S subunit
MYFSQEPTWSEALGLSEGATPTSRNRLKEDRFLAMRIPLPPLPEQKRIVAKVQSLASKIDEARELRTSVSDTLKALTASLHAHFSEPDERCFSEFVRLSEDRVKVEPSGSYPQIGIRAFGAGMFRKEAVSGCDTSYKHFNRLFPGALIVSQVKGWEGAVAVADDGLDAWFASPEYRTFSCIPGRCDPTYLKHLVRTRWFHAKLADATQGVGARRERVRPERLLATQVRMPSFARQQVLASVLEQAERIADGHAASEKQLDALMPAVLDRAFKGEL